MSLTGQVLLGASRRRRRGLVGGGAIALIVFGIMFLFVGLLLWSMCLFAGGILCSGTFIGEMGSIFFWMGAIPFGLGLLIAIVSNRRRALDTALQDDQRYEQSQRSLATVRFDLPTATPTLERAEAIGPVASKCPECGAPVNRGAPECDYCGQPFA